MTLKEQNRNMRITEYQLCLIYAIIQNISIPTSKRKIRAILTSDSELALSKNGNVIFK